MQVSQRRASRWVVLLATLTTFVSLASPSTAASTSTVGLATPARASVHAAKPLPRCSPTLLGASKSPPFTVFNCAGAAGRRMFAGLVAELRRVWLLEVTDMGQPVLPASRAIPVIILPPGMQVCLTGAVPLKCPPDVRFEDLSVLAETAPLPPYGVNSRLITSASLLISPDPKFLPLLPATVAHEFFHVLQLAHSAAALGSWIAEASATWAEHVYAPANTAAWPLRADYLRSFQSPQRSLTWVKDEDAHNYGAMVWPLLIEQRFGRKAVFNLWRQFDQVSEPAQVEGVINKIYPWAQYFPAFALHNLNVVAEPVLPARQTYQQTDPALPVGLTPEFVHTPWIPVIGRTYNTTITLNALQAQYDWVKGFQPKTRSVRIDFAASPNQFADALVLAKIGGSWRLSKSGPTGSIEYCRDRDQQNVQQLYILVTDHSYDPAAKVSGRYSLTGSSTCHSYMQER